jgi:hypothetical protein
MAAPDRFKIHQHVNLSGRIHVIKTAPKPGRHGKYGVAPLIGWNGVYLNNPPTYLIRELTESDLCRKRSIENFCTCGRIHVRPDYVIDPGR